MTSQAVSVPTSPPGLPILGQGHEVLALLALVWTAAVVVFVVQDDPWVWPVGLWASVTAIMT